MGVAALFVDPGGVYSRLEGVDLWDEARDARLYHGPYPVVCHPPCGPWGTMALGHGFKGKLGEDGGCFGAAVAACVRWGGVIEHPEASVAVKRLVGLPPLDLWQQCLNGWWGIRIYQSAYGYSVPKRTTIAYFSPTGAIPINPPVKGRGNPTKRLDELPGGGYERIKTVEPLANWLISLAKCSRDNVSEKPALEAGKTNNVPGGEL